MVAQKRRALTALPEHLGSNPSVVPVLENLMLASKGIRHVHGKTPTYIK